MPLQLDLEEEYIHHHRPFRPACGRSPRAQYGKMFPAGS